MTRSPLRFGIHFAFLVLSGIPFGVLRAESIYLYQRGYVAGGLDANTALTAQAVAAYRRGHPEVEIQVLGIPWTREGDLKLRAVLLNRDRIDLFRVTNDQLPAFIPKRGRLLSAIDPFLTAEDRDDLSAGAIEAVTFDGQVMAWPLWSTALAVIGNRSIMRARGVDRGAEDATWTWDEFVDALKRTTYEDEWGRKVWGLTAPARPPLFEWSPLLFAHAGPVFTGGRDALEFSPDLASALDRVASLRDLGVVSASFGVDDQNTAQQQFLDGRAAFILSSPAFIRTLAARGFEYVILPPPVGDFGQPITSGALGCFAVVDHPGDPDRLAAAHAFARYLTSGEIESEVEGWYLAAPVRRSAKKFAMDPRYTGLSEIARTAFYLNPPGGSGFLEQTIIPKFQAALIGELHSDRALEEIREAYEREFAWR